MVDSVIVLDELMAGHSPKSSQFDQARQHGKVHHLMDTEVRAMECLTHTSDVVKLCFEMLGCLSILIYEGSLSGGQKGVQDGSGF